MRMDSIFSGPAKPIGTTSRPCLYRRDIIITFRLRARIGNYSKMNRASTWHCVCERLLQNVAVAVIRIFLGALFILNESICLSQSTPPSPVSVVADPGVITTNQDVSPAGIQEIFEGRVYGVPFAPSGRLLFATVAGLGGDLPPTEIYKLDWVANRVLSTRTLQEAPAIQGGTYDPVSDQFLIAALGSSKIGAADRTKNTDADQTMVNLIAVDNSGTHTVLPAIAANSAGRIALPSTINPRNHIAVIPLTFNNEVGVLDLDRHTLRSRIKTGVLPVAALIDYNPSAVLVGTNRRRAVTGSSKLASPVTDICNRSIVAHNCGNG